MKIIKSITMTIAVLAVSSTLSVAQKTAPMVSSYLIKANGAYERVLVLGANQGGQIFYKTNVKSTKTTRAAISSFSGIWLFEPKDFTDAKNLFKARKYQEAKAAFIALQKRYSNYKYLEDNCFELSQYFEMECYRKLKDYKTLISKLELYAPDKLTRPAQIMQTKLYRMYDAVYKKDWRRLSNLCESYEDLELTLGQRAQVAFCKGLALEGQKQDNEALNAYANAMTADFTRSAGIVREAALNSLRIFAADNDVKLAMKLWKTPEEKASSPGYRKLAEANALARLYDKAGLGAGVALPAEYKKFQNFTSDEMRKRLEEKAKKSKKSK